MQRPFSARWSFLGVGLSRKKIGSSEMNSYFLWSILNSLESSRCTAMMSGLLPSTPPALYSSTFGLLGFLWRGLSPVSSIYLTLSSKALSKRSLPPEISRFASPPLIRPGCWVTLIDSKRKLFLLWLLVWLWREEEPPTVMLRRWVPFRWDGEKMESIRNNLIYSNPLITLLLLSQWLTL